MWITISFPLMDFHKKVISEIFDMVLNAEAVTQRCSVKNSGPKNFGKFTGKNL